MGTRKRKAVQKASSAMKKSKKAKGKERAAPQDGGSDSDAWLTANDGPDPRTPDPGQPTSTESKPIGHQLTQAFSRNRSLKGVYIAWSLDHMKDLTLACAG